MLSSKINKLKKKSFREAYVRSSLTHGIAHQIRDLRVQRGWSQIDLANKLGLKNQSAVARMEDPSYGRLSIATLLKLCSVFDIALSVKFQSFGKFLLDRQDLSSEALRADGFEDDRLIEGLTNLESYQKKTEQLCTSNSSYRNFQINDQHTKYTKVTNNWGFTCK